MADQNVCVSVLDFEPDSDMYKDMDSPSVCTLCAYGEDSTESPPEDYGCECPLDRPLDLENYSRS